MHFFTSEEGFTLRAFSERNLIAREMKSNLISKIFSSFNIHLKLFLPRDIYFRAQVLCEDVEDITGESFEIDNLVEMLLIDFLDEVIKYQNIKEIYKLLLDYDRGTTNIRLIHYQEHKAEEVPLYPMRKKSDEYEEYYCKVKRKLALRGEVMLQDIAMIYPNHPFTLERVLEILLIDFIIKYRKGEAKAIIREMVMNG